MRTIKFRIWNKTGKRMLYDSGLEVKGVKIISENTMQFTGLKDQFGKEIYEGDIVEYHKGIWKVGFMMGKFSLFTDSSNLSTTIIEKSIRPRTEEQEIAEKLGVWWTSCKVIGNIYETSELLNNGVKEGKQE